MPGNKPLYDLPIWLLERETWALIWHLDAMTVLIDSHPKKISDENALTNVNVNPYLPTFDLSISEIMLGMRYYPDILKLIH